MKLYYSPGTCACACHIVLEWAGKPYDLQKVSIHGTKSPELLQVNPQGAVPVLEENGWVLTQNLAIMNYLIDSSSEEKRFGDGSAKQRAEINRWLAFLNSDLHTAFKPLFGSTAYLGDAKVIEQTKINATQAVVRMLTQVNAHLEKQDYLASTRSPADAYLYVILRWVKSLAIDVSTLKALHAFVQRMEADSGVQKALTMEGLGNL